MQLSFDELLAPGYRRKFITTSSGKRREIFVPNDAMREVHQTLLRDLRRHSAQPEFGRVYSRRSPIANAAAHAGNRFVYKVDLFNAFPSVKLNWLIPILADAKSSLWMGAEGLEEFLKAHALQPSGTGLMVGMPSSPDLFDRVVSERLDRVLNEIALNSGLTYTRYLDDMVFSSWKPIGERRKSRIRKAIKDGGFRISFSKTGTFDIRTRPVLITRVRLGIVRPDLDQMIHWADFARDGIFLPRRWLNRLSGALHAYSQGADVSVSQIEGMMGALREYHQYTIGHYPAIQRVWRKYMQLRSQLRPGASLDGADDYWQTHFSRGDALAEHALFNRY